MMAESPKDALLVHFWKMVRRGRSVNRCPARFVEATLRHGFLRNRIATPQSFCYPGRMVHFLVPAASPRSADLAIDLGTANTLVIERGSGVIFNEPSVCCFSGAGTRPALFAAGSEANAMLDRVSRPLRIARPLRGGVLSDMAAARELLRFAARRARGAWRPGPWRLRALIGVPADATQAEQRALLTAAHDAGLPHARLLAEPLMAAIGADLAIDEARGRMVVDCGAGTTEVAVISLGGICLSSTARIGGETLDMALIDYLHLKHRFQIGFATAERMKLELAHLLTSDGGLHAILAIKGKNLATGMPETLSLPASDLVAVYEKHLKQIIDTIRSALRRTSPELSKDIFEDGITLTGGAAMTGLLCQRIADMTGLGAEIADDPLDCVARGLGRIMDNGR